MVAMESEQLPVVPTASLLGDAPLIVPKSIPQRDPNFYMDNTYVTFLVDNILFKVPRFQLSKRSKFFRDLFSLPPCDPSNPEGSSDENPIVIPSKHVVSAEDFRSLLKLLYRDPLDLPPQQPESVEEWKSVLKLASFWEFNDIRKLAASKLETLLMKDSKTSAVDNISMGRTFNISNWLLRGYKALVLRHEPISAEEAAQIGWSSALKLCHARERYFHFCHKCNRSLNEQCSEQKCSRCRDYSERLVQIPDVTLDIHLKEYFTDELKEMDAIST